MSAITPKRRKPFFLYDVVHTDGDVIERAVSLRAAKHTVKTWNDITPVPTVRIRKAWRVVPIEASERKAVKR